MTVTEKNGKVTITFKLNEEPQVSSTGKMLHYFTSGGYQDAGVKHCDYPLRVSVFASIKNPDYVKPSKK